MSEETDSARRYTIRGRVQGVGFRYFTQQLGSQLGLVGWVKNRADGSVEAHAEGLAEKLAAFRAGLEQGPRLARVDEVHEAPAARRGGTAFRITS